MKSAAQNQVLHQLKLMETNLREIQCKLVKTPVLNLWQIVRAGWKENFAGTRGRRTLDFSV